jgi:hypothetical protein
MLAIGLIAFRLEPEGRLCLIGMAPLFWCSMPVLMGLQMSNVQILVVATSALSLALFSSRTPAGAVALATTKVYLACIVGLALWAGRLEVVSFSSETGDEVRRNSRGVVRDTSNRKPRH